MDSFYFLFRFSVCSFVFSVCFSFLSVCFSFLSLCFFRFCLLFHSFPPLCHSFLFFCFWMTFFVKDSYCWIVFLSSLLNFTFTLIFPLFNCYFCVSLLVFLCFSFFKFILCVTIFLFSVSHVSIEQCLGHPL